jgi:hypothetical protein
MRQQLDAFRGRNSGKGWAWFVQGTSKLTEHDYELLTGRSGSTQRQIVYPQKPTRRGPPTKLVRIAENYKGKKVRAVVFQGRRYTVSTWKDALLVLFEELRRRDPRKFEEIVLTLHGRKRPYVTRDRSALRIPGPIPNTLSLYFETNLSANSMVKLCYTLLEKMGYLNADLVFEIE